MPESTTTMSTTTTSQSTTMQIIDVNTVQKATEEYYDNYDNYEDYNYDDEYLDELYPTQDTAFTHPELKNELLFTGKITIPTTQEPIRVQSQDDLKIHKSDKVQIEIEEKNWIKNQNEVFPKDAPYTQSASSTKVSLMSFSCILLSIYAIFN